jgi:cytoskeletal protein CcmA (bactofilin family)
MTGEVSSTYAWGTMVCAEQNNVLGSSVIGADIVITGNIQASVDLHIEGRVNGDVACATLLMGESSVISGIIRAERVRIYGVVEARLMRPMSQ